MPQELAETTVYTEENEVETEVDEHADVDQKEESNEVDFDEGAKQTKEQNSENARRRREAERQAELKKATEEAREKAIIETLNGKNPYTGEEMKDSTDVQEYLTMREIEKNGGDPLSDYSKHLKQKEREKAEENRKAETEKEWYVKDRKDFSNKHPEVNLKELTEDKQFQRYAQGKVGVLPLSEIYEGFIDIVSESENKAKKIAKQMVANSKATPGALSTAGTAESTFFTKEQVLGMTKEEISKNYEKIKESQKKWK